MEAEAYRKAPSGSDPAVTAGNEGGAYRDLLATFEEQAGKTHVGWRQRFNTAEECRRIARFAVEANEQNLDRLAAEVG